MSTNYYGVRKKPSLYNREIHIGKSSAGWLFLFQDNDEFHTYPEFRRWLDNEVPSEYVLFNEYNEEISKEELLKIIDNKQKDEHCLANPDNFTYNKNVGGYRFNDRDFG